MADLFKSLKPEKHLSKSGFDLSQKHVFSMKSGQLIPCLALETVPDDYHEIDMVSLTRTLTLNTAAFLRGKMRYDFFFVPNSQLWHPFNQFISQRLDKHTTLQKGSKFCPNVSLSSVLQLILDDNSNEDIHGYKWRDNAVRLLDMLGYGNHSMLLDDTVSSDSKLVYIQNQSDKYVNVFRLAAYQHIWYDFYRNKFYDVLDDTDVSTGDVGDYVDFFNFDDLECTTAASSHLPVNTEAQKQRVRGLLGMRYVQWKKDLFTSSLPGQQFGVVSSVDLGFDPSTLSVIGNGSQIGTLSTGSDDYNVLVDKVRPSGGNYQADQTQGLIHGLRVEGGLDSSQLLYWDSGSLTGPGALLGKFSGSAAVNSLNGAVGLSVNGTPSVSFDVLSLYKAQMLQNWKQSTLRAGNMTDDNFMAHYGVSPRYEGDENVDFLGSFDATLNINAVEATSTTGQTINGKVGELGATGTAVARGNKITYKARDFGIIMCVASFLPESEYSSNMLDKANTLLEEFDYYTPEFENIGLEAIPFSVFNNNAPSSISNRVLGYAPRYWMYKTAVDKVHGEFARNAWFEPDEVGAEYTEHGLLGSLSPWVAPRNEQVMITETGYARTLSSFYVTPSVFNNVFGVAADSTQKTDTFLNNVFFDIKSIRPMSVLGLPQF